MIRNYKVILLATLLAITGCSSLPLLPSEVKVDAAIEDYQLPHAAKEDSALIYVIRPSWVIGIVPFGVYVDGKDADSRVGHNRTREYVFFKVEPGEHTVYSHASNWSQIDVTAKAGETIFFEQEQNAFVTNKLIRLSTNAGKYRVMNSKPGTLEQTGG